MGETIYIHRAPAAGSDGPAGIAFASGASVVYTGLEIHTEEEGEFPIQDMRALLRQAGTPGFQVRSMASPADREGKAYVHYTAWIETYTGLMDQRILDGRSLERCRAITEEHPENTLVLLDRDGQVAGFACYVPRARDFVSVPEAAEISALYLLSAYQGLGLGRMLLEACLARLARPRVALFVLQGNEKAVGFYEHMGFSMTGHQLMDRINGAELIELEMVLDRSVQGTGGVGFSSLS